MVINAQNRFLPGSKFGKTGPRDSPASDSDQQIKLFFEIRRQAVAHVNLTGNKQKIVRDSSFCRQINFFAPTRHHSAQRQNTAKIVAIRVFVRQEQYIFMRLDEFPRFRKFLSLLIINRYCHIYLFSPPREGESKRGSTEPYLLGHPLPLLMRRGSIF